MLSYTAPDGYDANGNPTSGGATTTAALGMDVGTDAGVGGNFTTTYTWYGLDASGNPIVGDGFTQNGNVTTYTGNYSLTVPNTNSHFGVPMYEMVEFVTQPGGVTNESTPDSFATTMFKYNIAAGTRVVTNPNPKIPATTYTVDSYGSTTEIDAPIGREPRPQHHHHDVGGPGFFPSAGAAAATLFQCGRPTYR